MELETETEDVYEPYTVAISLAQNDFDEAQFDSSVQEFLGSVYRSFLIRAERILKQLAVVKLRTDSTVLKLSSSLLVLEKFFAAASHVLKKYMADEVARSACGKDFLRNVFIISCRLMAEDYDNVQLTRVVYKILAVLNQWLQYSQDLIQELKQQELLTKPLDLLDRISMATSHSAIIEHQPTINQILTKATISLLNIVKICLRDSGEHSHANTRLTQSIGPFLTSPSVKIRISSKIVLNSCHDTHTVLILQKDELDFMIEKICSKAISQSIMDDEEDYLSKSDLFAFLTSCAQHKNNQELMLERNLSEILSELMEDGTEAEQSLMAELICAILSETDSFPADSIQSSECVTPVNSVHEAKEADSGAVAKDISHDEGSVEAIVILLSEIAKLMQVYLRQPSRGSGLHMVAACVSLIWGLTKHSEESTVVEIADSIAQKHGLNSSMPAVKCLSTIQAAISGILHPCLIQWTKFSQSICERLTESGMVIYLTGELEFLQSAMEMNKGGILFSQYVIMCLEMTLSILLNCVLVKNILPAFDFANSAMFLIPLASCTNLSIRITAKSILCFLRHHLDESSMKLLELVDSKEQAFILKSAQPDLESFNSGLQILTSFSQIKENQDLLSTNDMFQHISDILLKGVESAQEIVLQLLWNLLHSERAKGMIEKEYSVILKTLEGLQTQTNSGLQSLAFCVLWCAGKSDPLDHQACLKYAKGCYQHGRYSECTMWCSHICKNSTKQTLLNDAELLKGKALYLFCKEEIRSSKVTTSTEHEPQKLDNKCFSKLKESIILLGRANDQNHLDDDGSRCLDWAMVDMIRESNKLGDCKRCLLCRRKTPLKRSHIYPRSILKVVAEPHVSEGEYKVFLHDLRGKPKSAGEITYWMLCGICEERFSQNGENEFCRDFFKPIFQAVQQDTKIANTQSRTCESLNISYDQWFYNFCVGVIFRGLAVSMMPHCRNREEIYSVFLNCRNHFLSLPVKIKKVSEQKQKGISEKSALESSAKQSAGARGEHIPVIILINPTVLSDDLASQLERIPFLPNTLLNSSAAVLSALNLESGETSYTFDAPFFLARLGIVNIIVKFNARNDACVNEKYCVKPDGGTYQVPSEDDRWNNIPSGLWELLQKDAENNQASNIEYFLRQASDPRILKLMMEDEDGLAELDNELSFADPTQINEELFQSPDPLIQDSAETMPLEAVLQLRSLPIPEYFIGENQLNLLPKGFSFFDRMGHLSSRSVILPKNHRILLHATDPNARIIVFLCIGAEKGKFSPDLPYLIILLSREGMTIIEGVVLTPDGNIASFMSDLERHSGTAHPFRKHVMPIIQVVVDTILPNMLAENGFENLNTVIHWTKFHWSLQEFPSLDVKCAFDGCWYCSDLCNVCMLPSRTEFNRQVGHNLQKCCSERCLEVASEEESDTSHISIYVQKGSVGHSFEFLPPTASLLFHAEKLTTTHLAGKTLVKISLVMDKTANGVSFLVLQQLRISGHQVILGFTISEDLSILEPLTPYITNKNVKVNFEKVKEESYIKIMIQEALLKTFGHYKMQLLTESNLCVVLQSVGNLVLEERPIPSPGKGEVLLQVCSVGVGQSDIQYWVDGRIGDSVVTEPMVLGHESSGIVIATGEGVKDLKTGDRVSIEPGAPCLMCSFCKEGCYNLCRDLKFCTTPPTDGSLARFYVHPADFCHKLPTHISFDEGALLKPLSVAVHACQHAGVGAGSKVLVCGAGPIGLACLLVAKASGASEVIITDSDENRLLFAKEIGATYTVKVATADSQTLGKQIIDILGCRPDQTIECSGAEFSITAATDATCPGGVLALIDLGTTEIRMPNTDMASREVDICGIFPHKNCYHTALMMVASGHVDIKSLITHSYKLEDSVQAFERAKTGGDAIKVMIRCNMME